MDGASKPARGASKPARGASKPARVLPDQFAHAGEASAARSLLYEARLGTFHQLSLRDHVDYRWLQDLSIVSASKLLRATRARFQDLIRRLQDAQSNGYRPVFALHLVRHV